MTETGRQKGPKGGQKWFFVCYVILDKKRDLRDKNGDEAQPLRAKLV